VVNGQLSRRCFDGEKFGDGLKREDQKADKRKRMHELLGKVEEKGGDIMVG